MLRKTRQFEPNNADGARRAANRDKTYERLGRVLPSASSSTLIRGIPELKRLATTRLPVTRQASSGSDTPVRTYWLGSSQTKRLPRSLRVLAATSIELGEAKSH